MKRLAFILLLTTMVLGVRNTNAQDLNETLEGVGMAYAKGYVQPLVDAFGADLNSGLFHTAKIGGGPVPMLDIYLGLKVFGAVISPDDRTMNLTYVAPQAFTGSDGGRYTVDVTFDIQDAPTVFGDTNSPGVVVASVNETVSAGPDGQMGTADDIAINEESTLELAPGLIKTPIAPLLIPQAGIGSLFGTSLMVRYLPRVEVGAFGSIGFLGLGARHSVSQYLPASPVDLAAQITWQKLGIQDIDDTEVLGASMWAMSAIASKTFFVATLYAGVQLESAKIDVEYTFTDPQGELPDEEISFSMKGRNRVRALAGFGVSAGPFLLNVDYSLGSINVVSAGLGLAF